MDNNLQPNNVNNPSVIPQTPEMNNNGYNQSPPPQNTLPNAPLPSNSSMGGQITSVIPNQPSNNENVSLGTTSNVTYSDTLSNISAPTGNNEPALGNNDNQFINNETQYNETSLNDLNVDGKYNRMEERPDYINDKQVRENMAPTKKNTVTITKELKTVFLIAVVLLVFIIIMPMIFDLLNNLRFH